MKTIRWVAVITLSLPPLTLAADPAPRPQAPPLLSHEELQKRLSDPNLRLLDARPKPDYEKGHVPGAVWVDVKSFAPLIKPQPNADKAAWSHALAPLGIGTETEVYVYDADRQHDAGRVWWLISYAAGDRRVGLVDGGFPLWEREKRPVSSEVTAVPAREFEVTFHARRPVPLAEVQAISKGGDVQLVDAHSAAEYRGEKKPSAEGARAGHIPGARSLDLYDLVDADGKFLDAPALRKKVEGAGVSLENPIVVYSAGGGRSGGVVFALRRLGAPARHYVQGLSDWASDPSAPVVRGTEPGRRAE